MNINVEGLLNGLMVYWDGEKKAARYYVHLLIGDEQVSVEFDPYKQQNVKKYHDISFQEIALIEIERNIKFHSFMNLAKIDETISELGTYGYTGVKKTGKNYYIYVEAEDKNGKIISKSETILGVVPSLSAGGIVKERCRRN